MKILEDDPKNEHDPKNKDDNKNVDVTLRYFLLFIFIQLFISDRALSLRFGWIIFLSLPSSELNLWLTYFVLQILGCEKRWKKMLNIHIS